MGYIYILTNESLPGLVKIGITSRDPFSRAAELQTTGVPTPFVVAAAVKINDGSSVEKAVHSRLNEYRVSNGREFFKVGVYKSLEALLICAQDYINTSESDEISDTGENVNREVDRQIEHALSLLVPGALYNPLAAEGILSDLAKNSPKSMVELGKLLKSKKSVSNREYSSNMKKAQLYFEGAASVGYADAFYELGNIDVDNWEYINSYFLLETDDIKLVHRVEDMLYKQSKVEKLPESFYSVRVFAIISNMISDFWSKYDECARSYTDTLFKLRSDYPGIFEMIGYSNFFNWRDMEAYRNRFATIDFILGPDDKYMTYNKFLGIEEELFNSALLCSILTDYLRIMQHRKGLIADDEYYNKYPVEEIYQIMLYQLDRFPTKK